MFYSILPGLLEFLAVASSLIAFGLTANKTRIKFLARSHLSMEIRKNSDDLKKLKVEIVNFDLEAAATILRKYEVNLSEAERREVESALGQASPDGRAGYMRGVIGRAEVADRAGA